MQINKIVIIFLLVSSSILFAGNPPAEPTQSANTPPPDQLIEGQIVTEAIADGIFFLQQNIENAISNAFGASDILNEIKNIDNQIQKIKDKNNITPIEQNITNLKPQFNNLAASIYAKSWDPQTQTNMFRQINTIIKNMQSDELVQTNLERIQTYMQQIVDKIAPDIARIQKLGLKIDAATRAEQNQVTNLVTQQLQFEAQKKQILAQDKVDKELAPLIRKRIQKENELHQKISTLASGMRIEIRNNNNTKNRLSLVGDLMISPRKTAQITEDAIIDPPSEAPSTD